MKVVRPSRYNGHHIGRNPADMHDASLLAYLLHNQTPAAAA